eukprot:4430793-Pleurochrysis_carterae.AAC.1
MVTRATTPASHIRSMGMKPSSLATPTQSYTGKTNVPLRRQRSSARGWQQRRITTQSPLLPNANAAGRLRICDR